MLSENDKQYITNILVDLVGGSGNPRSTLVSAFVGTDVANELTQGNPKELVRDALRLCLADRWDHQPTYLEILLTTFNLIEEDGRVYEIWERSKHRPPPESDPLLSVILNNSTPFVNRTSLRQRLLELASPSANFKPILVVNGDTKIGKSYSTNYIDHFSNHKRSIITYSMELDPDLGLEIGPEEVARDFVSLMGRSIANMPTADTNKKLYAKKLAFWILNEASQSPSQHWFVLDNFQGSTLREDTRNLIVELSSAVTNGVFKEKCRLILIGFNRALLKVSPGKIDEEEIAPCTNEDLTTALGEILARAETPIDVVKIFDLILKDLPTDHTKMSEVNHRLRLLLLAVIEVKEVLKMLPVTKKANFEEVLIAMITNLPNGADKDMEFKKRIVQLKKSVAAQI